MPNYADYLSIEPYTQNSVKSESNTENVPFEKNVLKCRPLYSGLIVLM